MFSATQGIASCSRGVCHPCFMTAAQSTDTRDDDEKRTAAAAAKTKDTGAIVAGKRKKAIGRSGRKMKIQSRVLK
jgi:hypothetical protein